MIIGDITEEEEKVQITITGRHFTITEPVREYVEERFSKLDKHYNKIIEAHVVLSVEKYRHHVEITLITKGSNIIVSVESNNMYASIDKIMGKIQTKLKRYWGRLKERSPRSNQERDESYLIKDDDQETLSLEAGPKLISRRKSRAKPMSVDEAVLQMGLTTSEFMVFRNADTNDINVIYRNKDGNYCLIET